MRTPLRCLALLAAAALPAGAQGIGDASVFAGPQYVRYTFGSSPSQKTVSQLSIPMAIVLPMGDRFSVDVSSSYANTEVQLGGVRTSSITGLTDTQVRGNLTFGDNAFILTLGLNLPTGQYTVPEGQQEAAGAIGNNFLLYPVVTMGSGFGATGGVALAQTVGSWNLGIGGSFRHSSQFDAYQVASKVLRFTPGNEYRLRVGLDRPVGDGSVAVGVTYSKFGSDAADSTTFSTGDRALAQASWFSPLGANTDFTLSAWNLYRAAGQVIGGASPWENVSNVNLAFGFHVGGLYVQPSAEGRAWQADGANAGKLANFGLHLRFAAGPLSLNPSVSYGLGTLNPIGGGTSVDLTGLRGTLIVRLH